jgi:hypothetical protein
MAASPRRKNKRKPAAKSGGDGGPTEAASFVAEQLVDLAQVARRHQLDVLGFLLDMSLMEAEEIVRRRGKASSPKP